VAPRVHLNKPEVAMKRILFPTLAGCGLILCALTANAEMPGQQLSSPLYSADEYQLAHSMFNRIAGDLTEAEKDAHHETLSETTQFDIAQGELAALQQDWDHGKYNTQEIQRTIAAVQKVLNGNRLLGQDNNALNADVGQLIDFETVYY
jgi:hypothetical protein